MALEDRGAQHDKVIVDKFTDIVDDYQMTTRDYVVRTHTDGETGNVEITLPPVSEAKGRFYTIVPRQIDNGTKVTITDFGDSEGWVDITLDTLQFGSLLYSDGVKWHRFGPIEINIEAPIILNGEGAPNPGDGSDGDYYIDTESLVFYGPKETGAWGEGTSMIGSDGIDGASFTSVGDMANTIIPYRFLQEGETMLELAVESPPNDDPHVVGASYYLNGLHETGDPGLYHPLGVQALVELATGAAFNPGDLVFCGADGKAIDIAQLPADNGEVGPEPPAVDYFYYPIGYAVSSLALDGAVSDTHVEVFMFPYGSTGDVVIDPKQGEGQY